MLDDNERGPALRILAVCFVAIACPIVIYHFAYSNVYINADSNVPTSAFQNSRYQKVYSILPKW